MYIKHYVDKSHAGVMVSCHGSAWTGPPVQVSSQFMPPRFVGGRVRGDVAAVRIRFADGTTETLQPTRGYVLYAAPLDRLTKATGAIAAEGLDGDGRVVGRVSFEPPPRTGG
jgi:hypothetical protein